MLSFGVIVVAALLWLGMLFGTALYAERHPNVFARRWPYVYALSLAVYCTSWTFYGTVTQAARYGWPLPPTFVGTILLYAFAAGAMVKLVRLARESNATSLADFIATRLGKDGWLAATVTAVVALGLIPYIALQLKAVAMSYAMLTRADGAALQPAWQDSALYVALLMALFAMLFGTRRVNASEHNRGLVLAIAFESLLKLAAMLALGAFVWWGIDIDASAAIAREPAATADGFAPLVLLGVLAMFTLPHQFHVGVIECRDEHHVRTARWLFPLYMVLIALPLIPLAHAGDALLAGRGVSSDLYVLALPLSQGREGLALFAFLGGLSAATGMIVVSTLTLSLMVGNHWLAPGLLRGAWMREGGDLRGVVLFLRRAGIVAIMLLAWVYSRQVAGNDALADVGAVSFSALATLAPALAFAVWRPQTPARAASFGIAVGFAFWCWALLVPVASEARGVAPDWLQAGPFGIAWLAPDGLFGLTGWSRLGRAVIASLFMGTLAIVVAAAWKKAPGKTPTHRFDADTLRSAGRRFLPLQRLEELLRDAPANGPVSTETAAGLERELASVLGSASARLLLDAARKEAGPGLDTVAAIVGEASQDLRFNQRLLEAALQNMSQGISVVDASLRLVAWNRRYAELFGFPDELLQVGRPVADLTRWALQRMPPRGDADAALRRKLAFMRAGTPHLSERVFPDGSIVEIRGNPMPGGGFVATFTDVTAFRRAEADLIQANETLEQRVDERTSLLQAAKGEAERANDAKSRFLAAIGHDLLQPLHAAHLFTDALAPQLDEPQRESVLQIRGALDSTTELLTGLLDMSRLEAGGLVPQTRDLPLAEVMDPLASEFRALAAERGLEFRYARTRVWVRSDPQLLRRVLQNFLANAVRYTAKGRVLLGARRCAGGVRIEVHDTGPGIPEQQQRAIFEEFRRGEGQGGQGLGLGLAIADRIAGLLKMPLALRSREGRGSVFSVVVPRIETAALPDVPAKLSMPGTKVLLVDNDPQALAALRSVLEGWGCRVVAACDAMAAQAGASDAEFWLFDFHLDDGETGVALREKLIASRTPRPTAILSADRSEAVRRTVHEAGLPLLLKPLKPLALKSVMDRMMAARTREP